MKLNYMQLPIKAHYFFFMAAMGPILPFLPVYGKQLGISALIMVLPGPIFPDHSINNVSCDLLPYCTSQDISKPYLCMGVKNAICHWTCKNKNFSLSIQFQAINEEINFASNSTCLIDKNSTSYCSENNNCNVICDKFEDSYCLYTSVTFWSFVLLMSLGNIGFNVSNCMSDAICFDILGENGQMGYGRQRVWGTIGFGISAFLAGYAVDYWSKGEIIKTYTPAFLLILIFTVIDLFCCKKLDLPLMTASTNILKDVIKLLKLKSIIIFLCFTTIAGILDSFIIYFLFWYLEDLAMTTNYMSKIKLIEGLIVAAETLGGEIIFFSFSGKILKKLGFGYTFTFCFICYALRLGLISLASNPWWVIPIELFMQGPTYALCYTTIVAYASKIAPPGTSATIQGIVAGMDDGFGFAIGSLIGGILYKLFGGVITLRIFSSIAAITAFIYLILYLKYLKDMIPDTKNNIEWKTPEEAGKKCTIAEN
ncbi:major facilitator superfamily domain-containing protein 6-A isoform X2 [Apis florea]|uniref:major facilitator superfamily domain-containing protein 6-A isoform X2 n=1 Tax=Apis florea TaxID=7463 RepID=UPI000629A007|nr:major facilitator superfamily domain-containing protein 6-A isoform X2 [Apis florea]